MERRGNAERLRSVQPTWATPWRVCLANQLSIRGADSVYMEFQTRRSALLLARIALSSKRVFSRTELCDLLWPDDDSDSTRGLLRNELARLKRSLGLSADVVLADRQSVRFNSDVACTDLGEMLNALNRATQSEDLRVR